MDLRAQILILVAEDDEHDQLLLIKALERTGRDITVEFVEDGEVLMTRLLRSPRPHLALIDLNMPRKSGLEALVAIRAEPSLRGLPVVVMTTSDNSAEVKRCYEIGANAFMTKPVLFRDFCLAIERLCAFWFDVATLSCDCSSSR